MSKASFNDCEQRFGNGVFSPTNRYENAGRKNTYETSVGQERKEYRQAEIRNNQEGHRLRLAKRELTHTELFAQAGKNLRGKFVGNVSWSAETVKLDLEARKVIERTDSTPQKY